MEKADNVIDILMNHKSIRKYKKEIPADEEIKSIVRAGQQAPFAAQLYSVLLKRKGKLPFGAPLLFTICVDLNKLEIIMKERDWEIATNDLSVLLFGIQDATLMAENMVIAGESMGMGSCFLGSTPYFAEKIIGEYSLPSRVFPLVQLVMGFPAEEKPPRPRYPLDFVLFEDKYPEFSDVQIKEAMEQMDRGYLEQDYYKDLRAKLPIKRNKKDNYTYENYSWTEHISRKWGQRYKSPEKILEQLKNCGFNLDFKAE